MGWDQRLLTAPYQGILFVDRKVLVSLGDGGTGAITGAQMNGQTLRLTWSEGAETTVSWARLKRRIGLRDMLPPRLAFVSDGGEAIGLLFTSSTPRHGLQYVEPHSVIAQLGRLTAADGEDSWTGGRPGA